MGEFKGPLYGLKDQSVLLSNPLHRPLSHVFVGSSDKQGAHGLKARSGLMKIQTFCKIQILLLLHGMDPHVPGVEIITKAEKKLTVACVIVPF